MKAIPRKDQATTIATHTETKSRKPPRSKLAHARKQRARGPYYRAPCFQLNGPLAAQLKHCNPAFGNDTEYKDGLTCGLSQSPPELAPGRGQSFSILVAWSAHSQQTHAICKSANAGPRDWASCSRHPSKPFVRHPPVWDSGARFSGSAAVIPQVSAQHSVWVDVVADVVESKCPKLPPMGRLRSMFSFALIAFPNPVAITKRCVCLY